MTKQEALDLIKLLSAVESWGMCTDMRMPDYLTEQVDVAMKILTKEVLG